MREEYDEKKCCLFTFHPSCMVCWWVLVWSGLHFSHYTFAFELRQFGRVIDRQILNITKSKIFEDCNHPSVMPKQLFAKSSLV
jgi:hypothetical protein